ncbi:MAG: hypothetical protein CMJ93_03040 [Planctomycetes bacterium]|nr:hypothetical protein [Planctomycetota bacterium]
MSLPIEADRVSETLSEFASVSHLDHVWPISPEDFSDYCQTDTHYTLTFKRKPGSLYGDIHCRLRRQLFNNLAVDYRCELVQRKLKAAGVWAYIRAFVGGGDLVDVHDIGASQSVYCLQYRKDGQTQAVTVKPEAAGYQSYFIAILGQLGWPTYRTQSDTFGGIHWRVSDYLGATTVHTLGMSGRAAHTSHGVALARHAALGDVFGRGDRHGNNYILSDDGDLLPIDVGYLFYPNNDDWLAQYIQGGVSEINALDPHQLAQFFSIYTDSIQFISDRYAALRAFSWDYGTAIGEQFDSVVSHRIVALRNQCPHRGWHRQTWYRDYYAEFWFRKAIKRWFYQLIQSDPSLLKDPMFNMYQYQSPQDRTTFFSLACSSIVDQICALAESRLGVDPQAVYESSVAAV